MIASYWTVDRIHNARFWRSFRLRTDIGIDYGRTNCLGLRDWGHRQESQKKRKNGILNKYSFRRKKIHFASLPFQIQSIERNGRKNGAWQELTPVGEEPRNSLPHSEHTLWFAVCHPHFKIEILFPFENKLLKLSLTQAIHSHKAILISSLILRFIYCITDFVHYVIENARRSKRGWCGIHIVDVTWKTYTSWECHWESFTWFFPIFFQWVHLKDVIASGWSGFYVWTAEFAWKLLKTWQ